MTAMFCQFVATTCNIEFWVDDSDCLALKFDNLLM